MQHFDCVGLVTSKLLTTEQENSVYTVGDGERNSPAYAPPNMR